MAERHASSPERALRGLLAWGARIRRGRSLSVKPSERRVDPSTAYERLVALGPDAENAKRLDESAELNTKKIVSLSQLTAGMAIDYIDRLARPIPSLSAEIGVEIVSHAYAAHLAVEQDPADFGVVDLPVLGTLPPLKHGRPPQDILTRAVKATRRGFPVIRAVSAPVWDGYVMLLSRRIHQTQPDDENLVAPEVIDGLARFGWVLRQVDIHYKLGPELRP
jgi:hypothetical protein